MQRPISYRSESVVGQWSDEVKARQPITSSNEFCDRPVLVIHSVLSPVVTKARRLLQLHFRNNVGVEAGYVRHFEKGESNKPFTNTRDTKFAGSNCNNPEVL